MDESPAPVLVLRFSLLHWNVQVDQLKEPSLLVVLVAG